VTRVYPGRSARNAERQRRVAAARRTSARRSRRRSRYSWMSRI